MNIELDEVVVLDVSDDALELAAGGAQRGDCVTNQAGPSCKQPWSLLRTLNLMKS